MLRSHKNIAFIAVLILSTLACQLGVAATAPADTATPIIIVVTATNLPPEPAAPIAPSPTAKPPTAEPPPPEPTLEPSATIEPVPTEIVHSVIPISSKPDEKAQTVYDQESRLNASLKEAYAGDEFLLGKFERPFDQQMSYLPYMDIIQTNLFRNKNDSFYLAVIYLQDNPSLLPEGQVGFGIEVDDNLDGRGDYLVWTKLPTSTEWSVAGVSVWKDANLDVGGTTPVKSDPSPQGDGYELNIFDAGGGADPDLVWSRISPDDPTRIEISFKKTLLDEDTIFMWAAWAVIGENPFALFDYNDHYTQETAGSPTKSDKKYYPVKDLYEIDNTCRSASGFTPKGNEPGLCPKPLQPTPEKSGSNCRWVVVPCTVFTIACFPTRQYVCD